MKFYPFILLLFLTGCATQPEYYSHSQTITLEGISRKTDVFYQNEKIMPKAEDEKNSSEQILNQKGYVISRSWNDQELIIQKEGFKDYHLSLNSVFTSEPWATAEYIDGNRESFPLLAMLVPVKTAKQVFDMVTSLAGFVFSVVTLSPIDAADNIVDTGVALVGLPKAIVLDVYDIISVPGTTIINPWREFQYNPVVILEPTEEFKKKCATQPNSFVSNEGCHLCSDSATVLYSIQEECLKCSNRRWTEGKCELK